MENGFLVGPLSHFPWTFFPVDKIVATLCYSCADHKYRNKKSQFCGDQKILTKTTTYCNNIVVNDKCISRSTALPILRMLFL